jgi:predicted ABC-type ATPase
VSRPSITFVAGPNGSGKSTLTSGNLDFFSAFPLLDPDALANAIQADARNASPLAAGRRVLQQIQDNLQNGRTFAVETTLSGKVYLQTMLDARDLGFHVNLIYVGTSEVSINLARVAKRVVLKGHNVAEADIRRRYQRSLDNLLIAAPRSDLAIIFDNSKAVAEDSSQCAYELVAVLNNVEKSETEWADPIPDWLLPLKRQMQSRS